MSKNRSYFLGIIIGLFFCCSIFLMSCQAANGTAIYLNKISVCIFEVGYRIEIDNNTAFVSDNDGVKIINIENPSKPKIITSILIEDGAFGLEIKDDVAFIAGDTSSLVIFNISNAEQPETIGQASGTGRAYCLATTNNYCYLGHMGDNIDIINITDLTNPTFVKSISGYNYDDVLIKDDLLFGASPSGGLTIFNISDPVNPITVKSLVSLSGANSLVLKENTLFIGCHAHGIKAVNISIPSQANIIKSIPQDDGGEAIGLAITDDFLCVADNWGIEIFNITTPQTMNKVAEYRRGVSAAHDLETVGNFVYVAKGFGLGVYEISDSKSNYFPPYLYYIIPVGIILVGCISYLIIRRRKKRKEKRNSRIMNPK
ncbi:MAG: hypothetical protein FK730_03270 [Asgard group archaeon]|nr:hypothetical protein [Asgard group archaeon]